MVLRLLKLVLVLILVFLAVLIGSLMLVSLMGRS